MKRVFKKEIKKKTFKVFNIENFEEINWLEFITFDS